jgi:bis(5'-adenosyl)-triphosphatase
MKPKNTCPFCVPSIGGSAFLASEHFLAIYNRRPILPGHSLVIPSHHYGRMLDLPDGLLAEMMNFGVRTARLLMQAFQAEAFDWTIQDGWAAGQTVPHLHLHIIPRKKGDLPEPGDWYPELEKSIHGAIDSDKRQQLSDDTFFFIVKQLKKTVEEKGL